MNKTTIQQTAPADHVEAWTDAALFDQYSLSQWINECCIANLPPAAAAALPELTYDATKARNVKSSRTDSNATNRLSFASSEEHRAAYDREATANGMSRSEWVRWCCNGNLPETAQTRLSSARRRGQRSD